jgi:hypothetical protein
LPADTVSRLEAALGNITKDLEEFAVALFTVSTSHLWGGVSFLFAIGAAEHLQE